MKYQLKGDCSLISLLAFTNTKTTDLYLITIYLKKNNRSFKSIFKNGLEIDQSDFFEYIKKTSYQSGVAMFSDGRFSKIET